MELLFGLGAHYNAAVPSLRGGWEAELSSLERSLQAARAGGGEAAIQRQHQRGRLTARERIGRLIDPGTAFFELMTLAGMDLYPEVGGCPGGGVVTGLGTVSGRRCMVIANDATVKAGAFFPISAKKVIRAQTIALENRLPTVYLVDSSGVYLPMQDEVFPDQDDFGRVFYLNAKMSAAGVYQVAAIMGNCVAGGAYLPVMCDLLIMTEGSGLYLAGPALVRAAIGQQIGSEELGGAAMHAELSGTVDLVASGDEAALEAVRDHLALQPPAPLAPWAAAREAPRAPELDLDLTELVSTDGSAPYDARQLLLALVDAGSLEEFRPRYGRSLLCGLARLGGYPVGLVANQRLLIKGRRVGPDGRLEPSWEVGGVIYPEAADKAARFILQCNQLGVPLIFFSDVTGFMVGRSAEQSGIIRKGAKMVQAVSNSVVPRLTVIVGGSYGAGHYAMSGKAYAPRFLLGWPSARYAVMGGSTAAKTLLDLQLAQLRRAGREPDPGELDQLRAEVEAGYAKTLSPYYAASRLWLDELIQPEQTRERLITSLQACAASPLADWKLGVFQT
jgi:acetyl-CoA carboxylase carboxyltransferase component